MYMVIFKSGHALEQYSKIKFRVRHSVRWLEYIPCLNCVYHLNVKTYEYIGISKLIKNKAKLMNIGDHLLFCDNSGSFDDWSILRSQNKMCSLELNESLIKYQASLKY